MSAAALLAELAQLGITIEAHGDRLRYSPRSSVTPDLADRLKAHKRELLAMLTAEGDAPTVVPISAIETWHHALNRLAGEFPAEVTEGLRSADVRWADDETDRTESPRIDARPEA